MESHHLLLSPFLDYLKFEKRYSRHTVLSYQTDLIQFFDFIITQYGETPLPQISHTYVRSWLAALKDDSISAKSINRKISSLKSFFKFQVRANAIQQTPMAKVTAPKNEKRLPQFVAEKDMKQLIDRSRFADDWTGITERMLLLLFYHSGIRLSEAIQLKESDINFSASSLKVLGKGSKERIVPIQTELKNELEHYLAEKKIAFTGAVADSLFISKKGKPLSPRSVYQSVHNKLNGATTIEKRSPHILRHTFATHLMNNGADLNAVKELLGHSSLAATQVYTHNNISTLKKVHKKAHPKA